MNCNEVRPLLSAYYDGVVTQGERVQVESHLAHCESCRHSLAEYRAIGADLRALPMPLAPAGLRRDVWRAIEAQGKGSKGVSGNAPLRGSVLALPQARRKQSFVTALSNVGRGWSKALPAALLVGVMVIVLVVMLVRKDGSAAAAALREESPITAYTQPVHILFSKRVLMVDTENHADAVSHTTLWETDVKPAVSVPVSITVIDTGSAGTPALSLMPKSGRWQPGASYEVRVDAPRISLGVDGSQLDTQLLTLTFSVAAYTPTATSTPTKTAIPTATSVPTDTPRPRNTAVAQITPEHTPVAPVEVTGTVASTTPSRPAATATSVKASPTIAPSATATAVPSMPTVAATYTEMPTSTGVPTQTAEAPSQTPTARSTATGTAIVTATPTHTVVPTPTRRATPSATPVKSTPTPHVTTPPTATPPCGIMPVNGFGKIWDSNPVVRNRAGCPTAYETALSLAAGERFQNGYMFWRGDTQTIYVFIGGPNDTVGTWASFPDTYQDGDPTVQPLATPPAGLYAPVRGFGKIYYNETIEGMSIQQALGWAIEPETNTTAAWQPYENGYALWTADRVIRFMYSKDYLWMRFADTYVAPTATPR